MDAVEAACRALADGLLVVYPTDTLYGLGCLAAEPDAFARLEAAKGIPQRRGVSVLFPDVATARAWTAWTPVAETLAAAHLPGPVTLVLGAAPDVPKHLLAPEGTLGVRVVDRPAAVRLARVGPVVSTSANVHGQPAATTIAEARAQFGASVAAYLDAGPLDGPPSTVVDARGPRPKVIREGALARKTIEEVSAHG